MARIDQQLPVSYAYRPTDAKSAFFVRRSRILKLFFVLSILSVLIFFGFLYFQQTPKSQKYFETAPIESPPVVKENQKPFQELFSPHGNHPKEMVPPTAESSPAESFLSGFVDPGFAIPLIRNLAIQFSDPVIETIAPVLESVLPQQRIQLIIKTMDLISQGKISSKEALLQSFIPIAQTAGTLFIDLFPDIGYMAVDEVCVLIDGLTRWIETADVSICGHFSNFLCENTLPLIGFSESSVPQATKIFERALRELLPDLSRVKPQDLTNVDAFFALLPRADRVQPIFMKLITEMASLKAQEALAGSLSDFLGKSKSEPSKPDPQKNKINGRRRNQWASKTPEDPKPVVESEGFDN